MIKRASLTPEETFLWQCVNQWREPSPLIAPDNLDWPRLVTVGVQNRMHTLLPRVLEETGQLDRLPAIARTALDDAAALYRLRAQWFKESLQRFLPLAAAAGLEIVIIKGLITCLNLYGDEAMRPGGDIDLLVRHRDVAAVMELLKQIEVDAFWPNLMQDAYYERHHLHQQRSTADLRVWYEIHWALDHPLTRQTINYEAMMDRATPGTLLGLPVRNQALPDFILTLIIHLVKHAVYLPSTWQHPELARIILGDGMLMYFVDIAEAIKQLTPDKAAWQQIVRLSQQWGIVEMTGPVLQVCQEFLATPVPDWVLAELRGEACGRVTRFAMNKMVEYTLAQYQGERQSKWWHFLLITNGAFILRPIRVLDLTTYCFPGQDYLRRRYGSASGLTGVGHFLKAMGQYGRMALDTVYFAWERHRRLKAIQYSTSLFNRLEPEQ
ncbi:MAG: nucleotidyltransferase family protein [Chloroflexi bacterium]|nr:nucleotidyltransferase family protein [Chloroflexota bacterium]MBP8056944.1 nucleotidyltransferase family protein [Chloroflexota bacterium]